MDTLIEEEFGDLVFVTFSSNTEDVLEFDSILFCKFCCIQMFWTSS